MAYPRFLRSRHFKMASGGSGQNFTSSAATPVWQDVTDADITLNARVGDVLEIMAAPFWKATTTVKGYGTFATMNGSTRLTVYNNTAYGGVSSWFAPNENIDRPANGLLYYTVTATDVVNGKVTVRFLGATETGGSRGIWSVYMCVKNLGPVDPT